MEQNGITLPEGAQAPQAPANLDTLFDDVIRDEGLQQNASQPVTMPTLPEHAFLEQPKPSVQPADPNNNDAVRYQYFQGQFDREKTRSADLERQLAEANAQIYQYNAANQPVAEPTEVPAGLPELVAPTMPEKPVAPQFYSREDAISDPASESARYDLSMQNWQNDQLMYMNDKMDYNSQVQERKGLEQKKVEEEANAYMRQEQEYNAKMNTVNSFIQSKGGDDRVMEAFVSQMSSPESISMENLWTVFCINNGISPSTMPSPPPVQQVRQPSQSFQQVQRNQQLPNMGLMPTQQNTDRLNPVQGMADWMKSQNDNLNKF